MLKHLLAQNTYTLMLRKSRFILHKWLMLYQLMLKIAYSVVKSTRNELIKLPVFSIKCKAMMGICIYWPTTDTLYLEKGANTAQLSKIEEWVIFYN